MTKARELSELADKVTVDGSGNMELAGTVAATAFTGDGSGLTGLGGGVPAGTVIYHAASSPPTGFVKANGASLSTTTYADLFAAIGYTFGGSGGSFNVPDLRGEFLRGWDDGRGIDSGRAIGSFQDEEFKSHNHTATTSSAGNHRHSYNASGASNGDTVSHSASTGRTKYTNYAGSHSHTVNVSNAGGSETRPRNVALLACIKY